MFFVPETLECKCTSQDCDSDRVFVRRIISKLPRLLVMMIKRFENTDKKLVEMVDIDMDLDLGQFTSDNQTTWPDEWVPEDCTDIAPEMTGPCANKRPLDTTTEAGRPAKRARVASRQNRRRESVTGDFATQQRELVRRCGGEEDFGLLIALYESLHTSQKPATEKKIDERKDIDDTPGPDPNTFKPVHDGLPTCEYKLRGTIHHHGKSVKHGHYTARVLIRDEWQEHDDALMRSLEDDVVFGDSQNESVYMLFYEYKP